MLRNVLRLSILFPFLAILLLPSQAQMPGQDVLRYDFSLWLNDSTDQIEGVARIQVTATELIKALHFDFMQVQKGKGMTVKSVAVDGEKANYMHGEEMLSIVYPAGLTPEDTVTVEIAYFGIPANGLVISKNKFGNRTFFGDNWPNRARHWLPVVDHPADKAYVTWRVYVPDHYQVIANGALKEKGPIPAHKQMAYVYSSRVPLPTKVMVIGVMEFSVEQAGTVGDIPVSTWVYPEEEEKGFYDYAMAIPILEWMQDWIAPYPYSKLANVQSNTIFQGMENASCIFYHENSIDGKRGEMDLFAHEIAHQWFGNSASEADWPHLWLSEGFASYFTHLYKEHREGSEAMRQSLLKDRQLIMFFAKTNPSRPVVDTAERDLMKLLNPNSYQKGSWVLHMLRHRLGDETFQRSIREYYDQYALSNATTRDFQQVVETTSGQDLDAFFTQWLYWPGYPEVSGTWKANSKKLKLKLEQLQARGTYELPLDIDIYYEGEEQPVRKQVLLNKARQAFSLDLEGAPVEKVILDPDVWILMKGQLTRKE